jgi:hypothetical protein
MIGMLCEIYVNDRKLFHFGSDCWPIEAART